MTANNLNPAQSNNFQVVISGGKNRIDYWARMVTLPGYSMPSAPTQYRNNEFSLPSNSRDLDNLQIEFLLDEDFENYKFFRRWMEEGLYGDGPIQNVMLDLTVIAMSSVKHPLHNFKFESSFPTMVSQLTLEHGIVDTLPLTFTVSFNYTKEVLDSGVSAHWDKLNGILKI